MKGGRVAWREGLFLRQQHFQQQDRHIDALVAAHARGAGPYCWGVIELQINRDLAVRPIRPRERIAAFHRLFRM